MPRSLIVNKSDLRTTQSIEVPAAQAADGQIVVAVNRFALTANNVSYGVAGDLLGYWGFFPAEEGWGRIPVWGIATVTQSKHADVSVGSRYYGYFPMAEELVMQPSTVSSLGFSDAIPHRAVLPPMYQEYVQVTEENGFAPAFDNHQLLYRILFATSFHLDDYLALQNFYGGNTVILGSASSKTAMGLAFLIKQRTGISCVGLTSAGNKDFVSGLGFYDAVATYDDVASLDASKPSIYVDMAGNRAVLAQVHRHLGDNLVASIGVGATHWNADAEGAAELPGPTPEFFFVPDHIIKRRDEMGADAYRQAIGAATNAFYGAVDDWIRIEEHPYTELSSVYQAMLDGVAPNRGIIVTVA